MLKSVLIAVLALIGGQPLAEPPPPPELAAAGEAWSVCVSDGIEGVAANSPPRSAARAILGQCRPLQERMAAMHTAWIDASALSANEKNEARAAMQRSSAAIEGQIIQAIQASRAED